jgi:L-alanine-DL-glutamate epimerase-like enolase superfamily enzyme
MRIDAVETSVESFPLTRPYAIAGEGPIAQVSNVILRVRAGGEVGLGAASPSDRVTGESLESCAAALDPAALAWLVGRDPRTLPALCREVAGRLPRNPAARTAIDAALHDLFARRLGLPLVEVLGRAHDGLPTSVTIGIRSTEAALLEAAEYIARGFRILKVKIGDSLEEDLERVTKLRERVGPSIGIRVDANEGYTADETERFFAASAGLGLELVEQPVPREHFPALRDLPAEWRSRIAADESLQDERDALALAASWGLGEPQGPSASPSPGCGIFNIKLMKCGGIEPARRIASIAEAAGIELMWGCMDESRISIAAALHAALASPATRYLHLDGSLDLARDVVEGGFTLEDGILRTTGAPGLGVAPTSD